MSDHIIQFLGHDAQYWIELERRLETKGDLSASALLQEVVGLRGKIAFYENRLSQMATLLPKDLRPSV